MKTGKQTTGKQYTPNLMPPMQPNFMQSNLPMPPNLPIQPQQMQMLSGSDQNFAEKLLEIAPPYLIQRIFANINNIQTLVMGGGWNTEDFKSSLTNEIQELTSNLKSPDLQLAIKELTDAADVPLTIFINEITEIIQKHSNDITYKLTSMAGNLVGEIPGVNVVSNSILAASNAVHVAKNVTEMAKDIVESLQIFKNDMTAVMEKYNPPMKQQFGPQLMGQQMMPQFTQPLMSQKQNGGSKSGGPHNMKDAKKHLHHLHRKKNRTLRRIHHSIHEFLTSNRNKRSIKAKTKH